MSGKASICPKNTMLKYGLDPMTSIKLEFILTKLIIIDAF